MQVRETHRKSVLAGYPLALASDKQVRFTMINNLFWTIITVLFAFWIFEQVMSFGGPLIHLVLVVLVIMIVINYLTKGKASL